MSGNLLRHPDFLRLWAGQSVSLFGSQVTTLALPLTAALVLDASAVQMGVLSAVQTLPFLLVGLFAGAWVDRLRRRPILVAADIGRALLLGSIPLAAALDHLTLGQLYVVGLLAGGLTVFFDVAYQSYLPSLVERRHLIEGNSRLEVTNSLARVTAPGLGGALVQALTAPYAILIDAVSFLASAAFILSIRRPEPRPATAGPQGSIWAEIGEGLRLVMRNAFLRPLAASTAVSNFSSGMVAAVYILFLTDTLRLKPSVIGLTYAVGSAGGIAAALVAGRVTRRLGLGPGVAGGKALIFVGAALIPLAGGPPVLAAAVLIASRFVGSAGAVVGNVGQVSLRQAITPDRLQGRINATMRFLDWGTLPLGALAGGVLGGAAGLRATLVLAAGGMALGLLLLLLSRVPALREAPQAERDPIAI